MTPTTTAAPVGPSSGLVRIAITSPDILAQIRQVFASKNLDVEIVRMPYVEVAVRPAAGAAPAPEVSPGVRPVRRLCAEYRLNVVRSEESPQGPTGPDAASPTVPIRASAVPGPSAWALSRRQDEVMALVSRGAQNAEIAARLQLREKTVKNHLNRIFRSLGAQNRIEAVLIWQSRHRDRAQQPGPVASIPRVRDGLPRPGGVLRTAATAPVARPVSAGTP